MKIYSSIKLSFLIYLTALSIGIGWSTLPALSNYIIEYPGLKLSQSQYGYLTFYLNVAAIISSFCIGIMRKRIHLKQLWVAGLFLLVIAELGIPATLFFSELNELSKFLIISSGEIFLGISIAILLGSLIAIITESFPSRTALRLMGMYGFISMGSTLTPYLVDLLAKVIDWGLVSLIFSSFSFVILFFVLFISIKKIDQKPIVESDYAFLKNKKFYGFFLIIFLYSFIETTFSYWAPIYLVNEGMKIERANLSLSFFWGAFALGQVLTTFIVYWLSPKKIYIFLCFLIIITLIWIISLKNLSLFPYLLGGLGCSGIYPLVVSFLGKEFPHVLFSSSWLVTGIYFLGVALTTLSISFELAMASALIKSLYFFTLIAVCALFFLSNILFLKRSVSDNN